MTAEKILEVVKKQLEEDTKEYLRTDAFMYDVALYADRLLFAIKALEKYEEKE